jgi:hypothetical protein
MIRRIVLFSLLAVLILTALSACAPKQAAGNEMDMSKLKMAPLSDMPAEVQQASVTVQEAYRFNVANPDIMKEIPCYCGCGAVGHTSNYSCYVKSDADGKVTFDQHALGCGICVDITRDAMRMTSQGKSPGEIKAYVDQTYSKYGASNMDK